MGEAEIDGRDGLVRTASGKLTDTVVDPMVVHLPDRVETTGSMVVEAEEYMVL